MTSRRTLLASAAALSVLSFAPAWADEPLPVVATFSILGDMVDAIGGDHIALTTLVGPSGDAHVYQPTPQAARAVSEAEVLFTNGLEFEGWLDRLVEAASFDGALAVATAGIDPIAYDDHDDHGEDHHDDDHHDDHKDHDDHADEEHHDDHHDGHKEHDDHADHEEHDDHADHAGHEGHDHGTYDPHTWLSAKLAVTYADNIAAALAQADPENAGDYYANRAAYVSELEALHVEITALIGGLPADKRTVVTSHDAFQYFARDYGLVFAAPQGLSTDSEASAKDVSEMIEHIRHDGISAVLVENIADSRLLEQIASETDATIGGTLYPGALSGEDGPAATYLDLMRHNATTLSDALGG